MGKGNDEISFPHLCQRPMDLEGKKPAPSTPIYSGEAHGGPRGGGRTSPLWAGSPPHSRPWGPPGWVAPPGGPPGPIRWSWYNTGDPESFPMAKIARPIYNSLPPDHSGTPRDVRDLIRDSEQLSGYRILISLQP